MDNRSFYKKVIILVIPMALQNLINVGVMAADVIMLGKVGEIALSGASLGGQVSFVLNLIMFGLASGASVLTAQYWGKGDTESIEKILGIALKFALLCGLLFSFITIAFPTQMMSIFTNDLEIIEEGSKYLAIIALTYPLSCISMTYLNIMRSVERVLISTLVYGSSLMLNIVINAVLIFGLFGAPKLGIVGAAIGTLCARLLEIVIVSIYASKINKAVRVRMSYIIHKDASLFQDFLKYSGPVILNELLWGMGYSANAAIVGRLGSSAVAANSVAHVTRQLAMVVVFGIANATAIMIGKAIGENNLEMAEAYGKKFTKLALIGGVMGGGVIFLIRPFIASGMGFTGQTEEYMMVFMGFMSIYVIFQGLNCTWIVGAFRAGGDIRYGLFLDIGFLWGGSILLGSIAAFVFHLDVRVVYAILLMDEVFKLPFSYRRFKKKKWLTNITQ